MGKTKAALMPLNMGARRAINFRGRQVLDVGRFYRGAPRTQGSPSSDTTLSSEPDSEPADQSDDLTRSLVRLINLPTYPLDRLSMRPRFGAHWSNPVHAAVSPRRGHRSHRGTHRLRNRALLCRSGDATSKATTVMLPTSCSPPSATTSVSSSPG